MSREIVKGREISAMDDWKMKRPTHWRRRLLVRPEQEGRSAGSENT